MTILKPIFRTALALALVSPLAISAVAHADAGDPVSRIGAYDDAVIGIAKVKLPLSARATKFEGVVKAYYDMPTIASLVIGPGWASASAADKAAVIAALTRHSAVSLAKNFASYDGTPFKVDPKPIARAGSQVVKVTIGSDTLFFRMHQSGSEWRILDVISGGVSQLALQRADLQTTVAQGLPAVVKKLEQLDTVK